MSQSLPPTHLSPQHFRALLTGLSRKHFGGDSSITDEYLKEQLFAERPSGVGEAEPWPPSDERLAKMFTQYVTFIRHAANESWTVAQLEAALSDSEFPKAHVEVFGAFWKAEREKVHDALVRESRWTYSCDPIKWRVDLCVASKGVERELNQPTALVEIACRPSARGKDEPTTMRFEMDRAKLAEVNAKFAAAQAVIDRVTATQ